MSEGAAAGNDGAFGALLSRLAADAATRPRTRHCGGA